jgi:O-acetyl-ADP-ribose deacetylase (regulator of RNase III)
MPIQTLTADITTLNVDAIVNAAAPALLGGGVDDGAIHRAAGPTLLSACRELPQVQPGVHCPTGEARITPGFALPARHVIQTVGPIWRGGNRDEPRQLAECYRRSIALLRTHGLRTIAFPAISCGVYGYPVELATGVAVTALHDALAGDASIALIARRCVRSASARSMQFEGIQGGQIAGLIALAIDAPGETAFENLGQRRVARQR